MTYADAERLIFDQLPNFQKRGLPDLKYNLDNILRLSEIIGNPHKRLKCIHVAGTNGKGSCSHFLASILQEQGFTVGLYTSPHLKDYRERFRINGKLIPKGDVLLFVEEIKAIILELKPTFFEVSVALAFYWFDKSKVDFAVIEVGLGGRLDSTNIITPIISVITSIGLDHQNILGDTREKIAREKAGIIKPGIPVVIGERDTETASVFEEIAADNNSSIYFTDDMTIARKSFNKSLLELEIISNDNNYNLTSPLSGEYQIQNLLTVIRTIEVLNTYTDHTIKVMSIENGVYQVIDSSGLRGRWQKLGEKPLVICDTGHNKDAWKLLSPQISRVPVDGVKFAILGFSNDKDISSIVDLLPKNIRLYFTEFNSTRSLTIKAAKLLPVNFEDYFENVNIALEEVKNKATSQDFIFIGGSTFVVAEIDDL